MQTPMSCIIPKLFFCLEEFFVVQIFYLMDFRILEVMQGFNIGQGIYQKITVGAIRPKLGNRM